MAVLLCPEVLDKSAFISNGSSIFSGSLNT